MNSSAHMALRRKTSETQRGASYARGGDDKMFGKQAAGPDTPGRTGKVQTPAPGAQRAVGGPQTSGHSRSVPAAAGHTAPPRKGRGGEARKALPGQCGT
jgi:hypothetical protein